MSAASDAPPSSKAAAVAALVDALPQYPRHRYHHGEPLPPTVATINTLKANAGNRHANSTQLIAPIVRQLPTGTTSTNADTCATNAELIANGRAKRAPLPYRHHPLQELVTSLDDSLLNHRPMRGRHQSFTHAPAAAPQPATVDLRSPWLLWLQRHEARQHVAGERRAASMPCMPQPRVAPVRTEAPDQSEYLAFRQASIQATRLAAQQFKQRQIEREERRRAEADLPFGNEENESKQQLDAEAETDAPLSYRPSSSSTEANDSTSDSETDSATSSGVSSGGSGSTTGSRTPISHRSSVSTSTSVALAPTAGFPVWSALCLTSLFPLAPSHSLVSYLQFLSQVCVVMPLRHDAQNVIVESLHLAVVTAATKEQQREPHTDIDTATNSQPELASPPAEFQIPFVLLLEPLSSPALSNTSTVDHPSLASVLSFHYARLCHYKFRASALSIKHARHLMLALKLATAHTRTYASSEASTTAATERSSIRSLLRQALFDASPAADAETPLSLELFVVLFSLHFAFHRFPVVSLPQLIDDVNQSFYNFLPITGEESLVAAMKNEDKADRERKREARLVREAARQQQQDQRQRTRNDKLVRLLQQFPQLRDHVTLNAETQSYEFSEFIPKVLPPLPLPPPARAQAPRHSRTR